MVGLEPTACALRVRCSTSEPHQRIAGGEFLVLNLIIMHANINI